MSIWSLVEDIVDSVYKPSGYLHKLEKDGKVQTKFEDAYKDIYSL